MTYEEILEKVVSKLKSERKLTRKGHKTKVTFNDSTFFKVRIREICKILLQLQDDEGVVKIIDALQPIESVSTEQIINPSDNDDYEGVEEISIELDESFDRWYSSYLSKKKGLLENLSFINLLKIYDVLLDIEEEFEIINKDTFTIHLLPRMIRFPILLPLDSLDMKYNYMDARMKALEYLNREGVLHQAILTSEGQGFDSIVSIHINVPKYQPFFERAQKLYIAHNKKVEEIKQNKTVSDKTQAQNTQSIPVSELVYTITYTNNRAILLNNLFQLARPDFDSENDLVFKYLIEHPNKKYTKDEIETSINQKLTKSLHKIVENLGFIGDFKKVFFEVTKTSICFHNPIPKSELEKIGVNYLKLPK